MVPPNMPTVLNEEIPPRPNKRFAMMRRPPERRSTTKKNTRRRRSDDCPSLRTSSTNFVVEAFQSRGDEEDDENDDDSSISSSSKQTISTKKEGLHSNYHRRRHQQHPPTVLLEKTSYPTTNDNYGLSSSSSRRLPAGAAKQKRAPATSGGGVCTREERSCAHAAMPRLARHNDASTITCLRISTVLTLIAATAIVAALSYNFMRSAELRRFEGEYFDSVVKVEQAVTNGILNKLNVAKTFSASYTSRYGASNPWPNVTMPYQDFAAQAVGLLEISNGLAISFNPIITNQNREEFETYATESASMLGAEELVTRSCEDDSGATCRIVADGIFRKAPGSPSVEAAAGGQEQDGTWINIDDPGLSPESRFPTTMVPVWQIYPIQSNWRAVMFNLHSEINRQRALDDMLEYHVPSITALLHLVQHEEMNPSSILFYPVFDQLKNSSTTDLLSRSVVASISVVFSWDDILREVLPSYIEGIIVVLETSVFNELPRQQWTYDVSGEVVTLLGEGDLHDSSFDKYEVQVKTSTVRAEYNDDDEALGFVVNLITYNMRIYPSKRFQKRYMTTKPFKMTVIVVSIFILTSAIFLCYDYLLNHRQNAVMAFAAKAGRIVDNLFPTNVRDRLFRDAETMHSPNVNDEMDEEQGGAGPNGQPERRQVLIQKILSIMMGRKATSGDGRNTSELSEVTLSHNTTPIADLFEETSIMFADIVGFTKWSSEHSPQDVFHLLEQLFFEFDKIAAKMNVFKLDRIGDCYIAVTGLPEERSDHGVVLCEFANECRSKMYDVINTLKDDLQGVERLNMRFGIHSGPVIAGVLRGQKTRFELFGDTMNTASRMESMSLPGRIQISEETAKLLINANKTKWIKPRKPLIYAKGKGALQTFWLEIDECSWTDNEA